MDAPVLNGHFTKLLHGRVVPRKEAMKYEGLRVASFQTFPKSVPQSALKLASAGFYYGGKADEVECFDCGLKLKDWGPKDDPFEVHKHNSPDCSHINNNTTENVPLANRSVNLEAQLPTTQEAARQQSTEHDAAKDDTGAGGFAMTASGAKQSAVPKMPLNSLHDYRYERYRLASFQNWPSNAAVRPEELAKSGFYYTGTEDRVQCTFCRGILRNWEPDDEADAEHRRHFAQCPFLNSLSVGNIPIGQENRYPEPQAASNVNNIPFPVHQRYENPATRHETFKGFPTNVVQNPAQFVRAGFFHTGISDQVKCFFCDGGLRNWEPNDDPWTEHARWFPRCGYLRLCKGDEFIKEVQGRYLPSKVKTALRKPTKIPGPKHPVDEEEVKKKMKTRTVRNVIDMGYDEKKVEKVVRRRIQDLGDDFFPSLESLFDAIEEYEDEENLDSGNGACAFPADVPDVRKRSKTKRSKNMVNRRLEFPSQSQARDSFVPDPDLSANVNIPFNLNQAGRAENTDIYDAEPHFQNEVLPLDEDEDAKALAEDVQRLKDERTCKVCMDEMANVVFLKCGHLVCCSNCAPAIRHCPVCKKTIKGSDLVLLT